MKSIRFNWSAISQSFFYIAGGPQDYAPKKVNSKKC